MNVVVVAHSDRSEAGAIEMDVRPTGFARSSRRLCAKGSAASTASTFDEIDIDAQMVGELLGEGGLLKQMTKVALERADHGASPSTPQQYARDYISCCTGRTP